MPKNAELLQRIMDYKSRMGQVVWPPADEDALALLTRYSGTIQNIDVPDTYKWLLSITNGLDFNSYVIYGTIVHTNPFLDSFRDVNEMLRQSPREHVFYGDTADELFVFELGSKRFQAVDRPSFSLLEEFENFDAMLAYILHSASEQLDF